MTKKNKLMVWGLLLLSSLLLSLPFLVPGCGAFALVALVPLLCAENIMYQLNARFAPLRLYACFVLWNSITTFWVCFATVGGGIAAILINSAVMTLIFCIFRLVRKWSTTLLAYIFLMLCWIAWERLYFSLDISWPWLTLGNSFARTLPLCQWYSLTGTLGGSLWIWLCNLAVFSLMLLMSDGSWQMRFNLKAKIASVAATILIFVLPIAASLVIWFQPEEEAEGEVPVLIVQPNIDPYHKFEALTQAQQNEILLSMIKSEITPADTLNGLLVLAPETFTNDIIVDNYNRSASWNEYVSFLSEYPRVNLLFGASSYEYLFSTNRPSYTARHISDDLWYESHNSALMLDGSGKTEIFHKSRLVVTVEMMPYPRVFRHIDKALGGVMGHCVGQKDISLLHFRDTVPLGCAVCYESVYGDYCRGYLQKGAKALTVITNDAWWGNTPGHSQHLSYASLRAIETRRCIARCGNTGISGFIDTKGRIVEKGPWWEKTTLRGTLPLHSSMTPFVLYGDVSGKICQWLSLMLFAAVLVRRIVDRKNKKLD